jgi:nickel-dependent lactate racemase
VPVPVDSNILRQGCDYPSPLLNLDRSIEKALDNAAGSIPLCKLIPPSGAVAVLISDMTRGRTAAAMLDPVLGYLARHGAGPDRTTVFVATGMHKSRSIEEIRNRLGSKDAADYRVVQHDARDDSSLVDSGTTSFGTRCLFNSEVARSALVVGVSAVSFHYFAGFGGGRKLILPGISGEETIIANHRRSLRSNSAEGLADRCRPGILGGNPVHEDMLEGARLLTSPVFMISAVPGAGEVPSFVSAGELDASHQVAAVRLRDDYSLPIGKRRSIVIASAGGYPRDINLLQAHKAIRHASLAVEDGGLLLIAASCSEGIGSDSLEEAFNNGREEVPERVGEKYTLNSQAAMSIYQITERINVMLHSDLPESLPDRFGFGRWRPDETPAIAGDAREDDLLVIPDAHSFLPVIEN